MNPAARVFALILITASCGRSGEPPRGKIDFPVLGENTGAPRGCDATTVAQRTADLFSAVNAGSLDIAERFFGLGTPAPFKWFSFGDRALPGGQFTTYSRDSINSFFLERRSHEFKVALRGIRFIKGDPELGTVSLSPLLFDYTSRDPKSGVKTTHRGAGKAGFHCNSGSFDGMSLGATTEQLWQSMYNDLSSLTRSTQPASSR